MKRAAVVVPARNEQALLSACLDAIEISVLQVDIPVFVVVVLDSCTDNTMAVAQARPWVTSICVDARSVGVARAAGAAAALRWAGDESHDDVWLATTDADSVVPPYWLSGQLELAAQGWEAVIGTVSVNDWSEHPARVQPLWASGYHAVEHHAHIHGANLGFTAAAYVDCGGWPALATNEDVAMVESLAGRRVIRTAALPVATSARRDPRAIGGFGDTLRDLAG
jgi:glycosyltransferase involved in cell wall biosynthesis